MGVRHVLILPALLLACTAMAAEPRTSDADVRALTEQIDRHISKGWAEVRAEPAPLADDAEFLRRVYLDLAGRIPTVEEARTFLDDAGPNRRARLVERLLSGPRYVTHLTNVYRALLIPEAGNNFQVRLQQAPFETWLRQQVAKDAGYDKLVRDLLTAPVGGVGGLGGAAALFGSDPGPITFYLAKEFKPENLAAGTARVFLGVSVECAQCHNHPFAEWKRDQFWSFAAFFSGIKSQRAMDFLLPGPEDASRREISVPGTGRVVQAKFLDGKEPQWKGRTGTRVTLADWVTSPDNPYFARATVNRMWAYFYGTGLVEPIDEMVGSSSVSSHPELLDLLAKEFAAHKFDVKYLIRAITASKAYQLSSAATHASQGERTLFARMPLRGLTAEQLFDSVAMATGYRDSGGGDDLITGIVGGQRSARSEFLTKFTVAERPTDIQTSVLQALTLMNGKVIADATSLEKSETLTAVVDAPFANTPDRIEALYLATLSRKPDSSELQRALAFVQEATRGAKSKDDKARQVAYRNAIGDVFWALLNSPEFVVNQ